MVAPINICFASNGTDILNHSVDILTEHSPHNDMLKDDIFNMYNEMDKVAVFDALRLRRPQLIPVYAFFHAEPAPIRLSRSNGQLRIEVSEREYHEGKGILEGDDFYEDDDATPEPTFYTVTDAITNVVTFMRRVFLHVGLHHWAAARQPLAPSSRTMRCSVWSATSSATSSVCETPMTPSTTATAASSTRHLHSKSNCRKTSADLSPLCPSC